MDLLMTLALDDGHDALFLEFAQSPLPNPVARLIAVIARSRRSPSEMSIILSQLTQAGVVAQADLPAIYGGLLEARGWGGSARPFVDQLARISQQNLSLELDEDTIWRLLDFGAKQEADLAARAALKRICGLLEQVEDDEVLVTALERLIEKTAWSEPVSELVLAWWRQFAQSLPSLRLGRLEKLSEARRGLEDIRACIQTLAGLRRMIGQRTLKAFADDMHQAFTTLEALIQAFDADPKRQLTFDAAAAHAALGQYEDLTSQERQVLANNIKELAQFIGLLGDRRTRPSLIRREDELDRQIMTGEQAPHSALDVLKWLSGYWGGLQRREDTED
jgi:hypothetical protein